MRDFVENPAKIMPRKTWVNREIRATENLENSVSVPAPPRPLLTALDLYKSNGRNAPPLLTANGYPLGYYNPKL
jgi:hypothetical protein